MNSICRAITSSIKSGKWLNIEYHNNNDGLNHRFWAAITDIDGLNKKISVDMFNITKGTSTIHTTLNFEQIVKAEVIDMSSCPFNERLDHKIRLNPSKFEWLKYEHFDNNILYYLLECDRLDTDPFQKRYAMIEGIDLEVLQKEKKYKLSEEQVKQVVDCIFFNDINLYETKSDEMALSVLSIDEGKKKYVVAYRTVCLNPKDMTLRLVGSVKVNPTFLIDGIRHSLSSYCELSADEFVDLLQTDFEAAKITLMEGMRPNQQIDTRPDFMLIERDCKLHLAQLFEKIQEQQNDGTLAMPMRAFFGDITPRNNGRSIPEIVLYDKRVNLDQMLVIYNAMKNPVTYVQGPPGTGKTQTLFNVVVSSYFRDYSVLISTMNNKPLDGIVEKLVFQGKYGEIPFPYLRLGNREAVIAATKRINALINGKLKGNPDLDKIRKIKTKSAQKNEELVQALTFYQMRKAIREEADFIVKIEDLSGPNPRLEAKKADIKARMNTIPKVDEKSVLDMFSPASEDSQYLQYLYYSAVFHLKKLTEPRYAELREICGIEDDETRANKFNGWCAIDENLKLLVEAFPVIFTTNISSDRLGTGDYLFDLVVMDESGQCSIAKSLLPIARGRSLLLVGDEDQLKPVVQLNQSVNAILRDRFKVSQVYDYVANSILSCMKSADQVSQRVMLRSHYRCGKKIIGFCNQKFYNGKLTFNESLPDGDVSLQNIQNSYRANASNLCVEEALGVVDYVVKSNLKDAVIITPFVNQMNFINDQLVKAGVKDVKAMTIHSVQGAEAKTVIMSCAISKRTADRTAKWLEEHREIVNVAVSRAQDNLIVFADKEAVEKILPKDSAWYELIKYSAARGEYKIESPIIGNVVIGKSNGSISEDEFFKTISQIVSTKKDYRFVERNRLAKNIFPKDKLLKDSEMEFDQVIYERRSLSRWKPVIIFEFDGGEHYFDQRRKKSDRYKEEVCKRNGVQLIRIGNDMSKDYERLKSLIKQFSKTESEEAEQVLLF